MYILSFTSLHLQPSRPSCVIICSLALLSCYLFPFFWSLMLSILIYHCIRVAPRFSSHSDVYLSCGQDRHLVLSHLDFSSQISLKGCPPLLAYGSESPKSTFISSVMDKKSDKGSKILLRWEHGLGMNAIETAPNGFGSSNIFVADTSKDVTCYNLIWVNTFKLFKISLKWPLIPLLKLSPGLGKSRRFQS